MLFCRKVDFVAISAVLSTHFCVEKNWTKNSMCGGEMTNSRYGKVLWNPRSNILPRYCPSSLYCLWLNFWKCIFPKCVPPESILCIFQKCVFPNCIHPKCILAKCTRIACLLGFASLCKENVGSLIDQIIFSIVYYQRSVEKLIDEKVIKTSRELRMLSPSLSIQRSQCNCSYCCSQLSEM